MVISSVWLWPLDHKKFGLIRSCLRLRIAYVQWCNEQSLVFTDLRHTVMSKATFSHISCSSIAANLQTPSKGNGETIPSPFFFLQQFGLIPSMPILVQHSFLSPNVTSAVTPWARKFFFFVWISYALCCGLFWLKTAVMFWTLWGSC